MVAELSDDVADKLQAILNHESDDRGGGFGENYLQAAAAWFAGLSDRDKAMADKADAAFAFGDELRAEEIAAPLPPAPRFPRNPAREYSNR
jgi:hypothetical protein